MPRGGKRPGAGAPRGNRNALRHGGYSRYVQQHLIPSLDPYPELQRWLIDYQRGQTRNKRGPRKSDTSLVNTLITILQLPPDHPARLTFEEQHPAFTPSPTPALPETPGDSFRETIVQAQKQSESINRP